MLIQSESDPMTFAIKLAFTGQVCWKSLALSVAEAVVSHPLLTSCVRSRNDSISIFDAAPNELTWVDSNLPPVISQLPLDDSGLPLGLNSQSDRIDLSRENGFKTFVSEHNGNTDIYFLFHHSACDGQGGFKFVEEVLARYHMIETGMQLPIIETKPELLSRRNPNCETLLPWHRRLMRCCFVLPRRILGMTKPAIAKIAVSRPAATAVSDQPVSAALEMPTLTLSKTETATIGRRAADQQCTTNELLLNHLFKVLIQWNQDSAENEGGRMRAIIPFSLRDNSHEAMPAANCVSMVYVDAGNPNDKNGALSSLSEQFKYIRKWQIEYSWNQTASFAFRSKRIAALLRKQANRHLCATVFSNLGNPFNNSELPVEEDEKIKVGGLELQSAHIAPPITDNTIAVFAAVFYTSRLTLTMNYCKTKLSRVDAKELMGRWSQSLKSLG